MNVTEFAEQVVFGTTLADKLTPPGRLSFEDCQATPRVQSLVSPARPAGLQMHSGPGAATPPRDSQLGNERSRGELLHFLANHELLATELMALVLLKFPAAPAEFRRGVLVTLQEEQEHTRLYLQRMKECGVEFGSFPLSGHFWRVVEPMQAPMDFVSRLSLTFEQANLDYSLHFASVFRQLGDLETSSMLERIYEDEVGHVRHGLRWFREWKDPEQSDWEAYQSALSFPMSPQRARGPLGAFNREGRLNAGLTTDFVDAVEVFRQSRSRTPTIRWFDPAVEAELAGQLSPRDEQLMDQLGRDLECLMVWLSKQDDVLLVRDVPSPSFRKRLLDASAELPEFVRFEERGTLCQRKLRNLSPWAWTPQNHLISETLLPVTREQPPSWCESHVDLFRKSWSTDRLREWLEDVDHPEWFMPGRCVGIQVGCERDIAERLSVLSKRGYEHAIFKLDLATSGRGQRRLPCAEPITESDKAWLRSVFSAGVGGVLEPELDRVVDLSFLWHYPTEANTPEFLGWTRALVTAGRRYAGTRLGRPFSDCAPELARFLLADGCASLHAVKTWLEPRIAQEMSRRNYRGFFGVDAFVARDTEGVFRVKPLVELNPRITMGHIALALERRLAPGVPAEFRILTRAEWDGLAGSVTDSSLSKLADGRWSEGILQLSDVQPQTKLIPVLLVGQDTIASFASGFAMPS